MSYAAIFPHGRCECCLKALAADEAYFYGYHCNHCAAAEFASLPECNCSFNRVMLARIAASQSAGAEGV